MKGAQRYDSAVEREYSRAELIALAKDRQARIEANLPRGLDENGEPLPPQPRWRVADYASCIENAWNRNERFRMLISDLPRRFHRSTRDRQEFALRDPPRLTETKWDALLASVAEHVALTHRHPVPAWCDEPRRFLAAFWRPMLPSVRFCMRTYMETPPAFTRHGIVIGGREFGAREGEREYGAVFRR